MYATYCRPTIDPSDLQFQQSRSRYHRLVLGLRFDNDIPPRRGISSRGLAIRRFHWARPVETLTTNMVGTAIVFEALRHATARKDYCCGSSAEYGFVDPSEFRLMSGEASPAPSVWCF